MMTKVNRYFVPATVLIALTCSLWHVGKSLPVHNVTITDACVSKARTFLLNITGILAQPSQNNLFNGINCAVQGMDLNTPTKTISVCAPKRPNCSGVKLTEYDQDECLRNVIEDLYYYENKLASYPNPDHQLGPSLLESLRDLMEDCFPGLIYRGTAQSATTSDNFFDEKVKLCKVLRGFQIRTITINRIFRYIHAGDHKM